MNYFLMLVMPGRLCGGAYFIHTQDQQQLATLQQQLTDMTAKGPKTGAAGSGSNSATPGASDPFAEPAHPQPKAPAPVAVVRDPSRSASIDAAANSAIAAENSDAQGTITTLDGRTFQNCKILKVEADGITFSHDDGITKVLFPLLRPETQKKYGYSPQQAILKTETEIQQQQTAAAPAAPGAGSRDDFESVG